MRYIFSCEERITWQLFELSDMYNAGLEVQGGHGLCCPLVLLALVPLQKFPIDLAVFPCPLKDEIPGLQWIFKSLCWSSVFVYTVKLRERIRLKFCTLLFI